MKLERLADLRESRNWTQKYVASYLCVTQRSYGHYENGTRSLPLEHLIKLTELYDVSSDYILGITDEKKRKGQILRSTSNTAPLTCGACNTQPEGLLTMA